MNDAKNLGGAAPRGSSGATLTLLSNIAFKIGDERVAWQGSFMSHYPEGVFPKILAYDESGYAMERLYETEYDRDSLAGFIYDTLDTRLWVNEATVHFDEEAHLEKVRGLSDPETWELVINSFTKVKWSALRRGLTHGDPTFENTLVNADGAIRMIDPLPATSAVPHLTSVDIGKMLQSALGFEAIRYGEPHSLSDVASVVDTLHRKVNDTNEWNASWYWAAVHLLRAIPYMPTLHVKNELRRLAHNVLLTSA